MHLLYRKVEELTCPTEKTSHSDVTDQEVQAADKGYYELKDTVYTWETSEYGVAALIFLMYVTYHLISKLRGNERNVSMNTFGIAMAMLGFVNYLISFTDYAT